jgi:hypothetical protein
MQQRFAQTLRFFARLITSQHTARANAADGCATLLKRRQDQEQVDEYLQGRLLALPIDEADPGRKGASDLRGA